MLPVYPSESDAFAALSVALEPLQTKSFSTVREVHAGYVLLGYALGKTLPDAMGMAPEASPLQDIILAALQKLLGSVDWQAVITQLLQMLLKPAPTPGPSPVGPTPSPVFHSPYFK